MFKSIILVLLIGIATVKAEEVAKLDAMGFLVDNIIEPLVTEIIDNAANMLTSAILGIFGKRDLVKLDAMGFLVDNIIEPLVTGIIDNAATMLTSALLGLFGKRNALVKLDAMGFLVDNIIEPLVTGIIDNAANMLTSALLGIFGKRDLAKLDAWGFITDNIIDPFIDTVIDNANTLIDTAIENTVNLITGAILGIFGKRGLDFAQLLQPILQQFLPGLIQSTINAINHLIGAILPLMRQVLFHLAGPAPHVGIVKALNQFEDEMKINVHLFLSHVINVAQNILNHVQLNQFVAQLNQIVSVFLNLSQFIEPIINHVFALLANPFVSNLLGQIIG